MKFSIGPDSNIIIDSSERTVILSDSELHTLGRIANQHRECGQRSGGLDPMTCGRYVDSNGKHEGWHAGFNPETGQTMTWTPREED